jgi:hypothetical protein
MRSDVFTNVFTDVELAPLVCGGARRITILRYVLWINPRISE